VVPYSFNDGDRAAVADAEALASGSGGKQMPASGAVEASVADDDIFAPLEDRVLRRTKDDLAPGDLVKVVSVDNITLKVRSAKNGR